MVLRGFFAGENGFYGSAQQMRRQRRVRLDGELFLGAESSAARSQLDLHLFLRHVQDAGDLAPVVSGPLALRENLNAISLRQCQACFGLEKSRIDQLRRESLLHKVSGSRQRGIYIAPRKGGGVEQVGVDMQIARRMHLGSAGLEGGEGIGYGSVHFVVHDRLFARPGVHGRRCRRPPGPAHRRRRRWFRRWLRRRANREC